LFTISPAICLVIHLYFELAPLCVDGSIQKAQRHHLFSEALSVRQAVVGLLREAPRKTAHSEKFIFGFTGE
jgi:hypothetical protein